MTTGTPTRRPFKQAARPNAYSWPSAGAWRSQRRHPSRRRRRKANTRANPRPRRAARVMPSYGSIPYPKSTTPAAAEVTARPGAERICAKKTRLRPAFARPSLQGARRPDRVPASEHTSVVTVPSRHRHCSSDGTLIVVGITSTGRGVQGRGACDHEIDDENAQSSPALAPAGRAGRDRLAHAMLAPPRAAAIKVTHKGRLAQWVERLLYTQDVGGSSPSPPTSLRACGASAGKPA